MCVVARLLLSLPLIVMLQSGAVSAQVPPPEVIAVRVEVLSAPDIRVRVNQIHAEPIRFRVVRESDNQPLPQVRVQVWVTVTICFGGDPNCFAQPHELYGRFVNGTNEVYSVDLTTDQQGMVSTPPLRAGSLNGTYTVDAFVYPSENPGGLWSGPRYGRVVVVQGGAIGGPTRIPASGADALLALGLLVAGLGWLALARRGIARP